MHPDILWFGDGTYRTIALTFDDGPHRLHTQPVLDTLKRHSIRASFFLLGQYVEQYPQIVKLIHQNGHHIGIHGYRHTPFPLENPETLRAQLEGTRNHLADICGISPEAIRDIRPPFGAFTRKTVSMLTDWGYRVVMWNNIPPHWMQPLAWTIQQTLDQIIPGGVIVLHDGHGHGEKVAQILEVIIPKFKAQGYDFIKLNQMETNRE